MRRESTGTTLCGEALHLPSSLWAQISPPAPELERLQKHADADVAIVGAGFTGLSAAIHLAEAGLTCTVLDAAQPGWGASGRNNGQVIAGLKQDPDVVEALYPGNVGRNLVQFGSDAPARVFGLIARHRIDCAATQSGWIQPAFTRSGIAAVQHRAKQWQDRGIETSIFEGDALAQRLGTPRYEIGWLDPRGGSLQPLAYVRGLADTALGLGVQIYDRTKVRSIEGKIGSFVLRAEQGTLTAKHVVIATGAYGEELIPGLCQSFVGVRTAQIATRPLPEAMRKTILPRGQVASDTRQLLTSFRLSPDGRLVMGGCGATAGLDHSRIVPFLQRAGNDLFATLGPLEWEFAWSGIFAATTDHLPHLHEPQPGIDIAIGCNGRGIAVSTSLGIEIARRVCGATRSEIALPISDMRAIPFHIFRRLGVAAVTRFKRIQDAFGA